MRRVKITVPVSFEINCSDIVETPRALKDFLEEYFFPSDGVDQVGLPKGWGTIKIEAEWEKSKEEII